jgi:hypothetical protein
MLRCVALVRTEIITRATWHNIPEDTILHSHRRENLKSYTVCLVSVCLFFIGKMKGIAFIKDPDGYWIEILSPTGMRKLLQ